MKEAESVGLPVGSSIHQLLTLSSNTYFIDFLSRLYKRQPVYVSPTSVRRVPTFLANAQGLLDRNETLGMILGTGGFPFQNKFNESFVYFDRR